jgi:peptidyl-prolyl cis-trans isomerase D
MLSTIREKTQGIIATFILALVVVPFALWGINSYFDSGSKLIVAKVGGMDISQVSYRRALDRLRGRVDPKQFDSPQFKQTVLNSLIDQALLAQDAQDQGYRVSDAQLAEGIKSLPYFQRDGHFDPTMYDTVLRREGLSPHEFESRLRDGGLTTQVQIGLSDSGIVTSAEISEISRLIAQQREVAYTLINFESMMSKVTVSGQGIEQYYSSHPEMFQIPEQVRVEYLRLSAGELNEAYQPTEDDLKKAYADEAGRYVTPAKRRVSHILITLPAQATDEQTKLALAKIQSIAKQARAGSDFAELAKKYSEDSVTAAKGGDLGEIRSGVLPKELEATIDSLKPGEISEPVRSPYGYHLLKLTAFTPEKRKPFAEVRKELVKLVRRRKGEEKFFDVAEKFRNLVYEQPDSLAPAAKALGLEIQKSDWFTRAGGPGIAANPKVVEAAFEPDVLSQARNSDAIEVNDGTLVAVRVAEHRPAARQPLAQVRAEIERVLKREQAKSEAQKLGEEWLRELRSGASSEALAKKRGFKYQPPKEFTRQPSAGTDPRLVEAAFRAPRPDKGKPSYDLVDLGDQGYAVLALVRVSDPSGKAQNDSARQQARALLTAHRGADYYANYRAGLRQKTKIKIYSDQL